MITIEVRPATPYRTREYGVLLESVTLHAVEGRGFHNPSFNHQVAVWENRNGKDPRGNPTDGEHTVYLSAQPTVISRKPAFYEYGETIHTGDLVTLTVNGFPIGTYVVKPQQLADPVLEPVGV